MKQTLRPRDLALREEPRPQDADHVRHLVAATGFFTLAEVEIAADLVRERLARGPASGYEFLLADGPGCLLGYSCFGRVPCSTVSWDLYWIAVSPDVQGVGLGQRLLQATEDRVRAAGGRALYAETSGRGLYRPTRGFYRRSGYQEAATLPDFYAPDDDKVIFRKALV